MSLYRKYRPLTFDDLVGQDHIEKTLRNALEQDRLAHAFLFSGPRGTGKTTTARILAKALLCEKGVGPSPDGHCDDCELIAEGRHPDVLELDAASQTGVDNVREEIISRLGYSPQRGSYKIYIIDEVHMLSTGAFNALLKTLEEPPAHVVFILCTTNPQSVPETIRSRCQRFDFRPIPSPEIAKSLKSIIEKEGVKADSEAIRLIARHSEGGMRDAITLLEQLISYSNGDITVKAVEDSLGEISSDALAELMLMIAERRSVDALYWVADQVERGADLVELVRSLMAFVRDLYVLKIVDDASGLVELGPEEVAIRKNLIEHFEGDARLARILAMLSELASQMRFSPEPRMLLELALVRMIEVEGESDFAALAERIERLEATLASGVAPKTAAQSSASPASRTEASVAPRTTVATDDNAADEVSVADSGTTATAGTEAGAIADSGVATTAGTGATTAEKVSSVEAPQAEVASSQASASKAPATRDFSREWREVLAQIRKNRPARAPIFSHAIASSGERDELLLTWPKNHEFSFSAAQGEKALVEQAMTDLYGQVHDFRFELALSEAPSGAQVREVVYEAPAAPEYEAPEYEGPSYGEPVELSASEPEATEEIAVDNLEAAAAESAVLEPATADDEEQARSAEAGAENPSAPATPPVSAENVELDEDIAASIALLGATVTEVIDTNEVEAKAEEFIEDPEEEPAFTQSSLFENN